MCKIQVKDGQFPGIYKITEKNTGKVYIGQTSRSINERLTQHVMTPAKGSAIDEAIQKKGKDEFTFETLAPMKDPTTEQLWFQEYYFIAKHRSYDETYGFNQTKGNRGKEFENFEAAFMRDFICVSDKLFKDIMKTYGIDFTGKRVLLINNFDESVKNFLEFQTGKENVDIIYESFDIEDKKELQDALGEYIKDELKKRYTPKQCVDLISNEIVMDKPNNRYDIVIANPPYGKIGNEITKAVVDNIDYGVFVNLLPANDYRRWHKEDALYQYVDINSMKAVQPGEFKDAYVTTMMCKVNKERALYISENEFEIENYGDKSLKKYFYENRKRSHYAFDTAICDPKFEQFDKVSIEKTFYIGHRDPKSCHLPYSLDSITTRYNLNKITKEDVIAESSKSRQALGMVGNFYLICLNTEKEKTNLSNFIYSDNGFRFMSKVFTALNCDSYISVNKYMPAVDWTKPQTVESILKEYGYTKDEIEEVVADLANFKSFDKGMEE